MKKILLIAGLLSTVSLHNAYAADYYAKYSGGNGEDQYYDYNPEASAESYNNYNTYSPAAPAKKNNAFKNFSIGMDYVVGSNSMASIQTPMNSPLLGGDVYNASTDDFEDSLKSLNGNIGWRPYRYFGIEAFYQQSLSDNSVQYREHYVTHDVFAQADYTMDYKAYGLDALVYIPATPWLDILASLGYANYDFNGEINFSAYDGSSSNPGSSEKLLYDESTGAIRYGAGAQIRLSEKLSFRGMYRYTSIGGKYFDNISEIALGVRYNF